MCSALAWFFAKRNLAGTARARRSDCEKVHPLLASSAAMGGRNLRLASRPSCFGIVTVSLSHEIGSFNAEQLRFSRIPATLPMTRATVAFGNRWSSASTSDFTIKQSESNSARSAFESGAVLVVAGEFNAMPQIYRARCADVAACAHECPLQYPLAR